MDQRAGSITMKLLPPLVAAVVLWLEPALVAISRSRDSVLPLATLLFLVALLHPRLRHFLVVTLCFFVCLYLLRERYRLDQMALPDMLRYDMVEAVRPLIVWSIAVLAALAGVGETIKPGTEWARRCYFGAATLFFIGLGVYDYGWHRSARSIVLCLTGVVALSLCIFAHRLGTDLDDIDVVGHTDDLEFQEARDMEHQAILRTREWKEPEGLDR